MIDILEKENLTLDDINSLILNQVEESINLDFKASESLSKQDKKKLEIAKDVSAFANSAGGYIIYGVNEENHKADSFSFVDGTIFTKEWIEQVIQTRIQRKIEDLRIFPIRENGDILKSIYVVKIPESFSAPHMTSDKRFYKRYNFESVQMEEYEIRNLYNRKEKTKLEIDRIFYDKSPKTEEFNNQNMSFRKFDFQIKNIGKAIEKNYKLFVSVDLKSNVIKWDPIRQNKNITSHKDNDGNTIISFFSISPIYPDEQLKIGSFELGIPDSLVNDSKQNYSLKLKLMYSNGIDEIEYELPIK